MYAIRSYYVITALEVVFLMFGGMDFYDSVSHAFTSMPTGGFSTKNTSIAHYNSFYIDMVITVFMLLAGINFTLHYQFLKGETLIFWKDSECRFFLGLTLILTAVMTFDLRITSYNVCYTKLLRAADFFLRNRYSPH